MPAEKLTKKRLIQILVVFTILISAFLHRTFSHQHSTDSAECSAEQCEKTKGK